MKPIRKNEKKKGLKNFKSFEGFFHISSKMKHRKESDVYLSDVIEKIAESIIHRAVSANATDVHIVIKNGYTHISFRIAYQLKPHLKIPAEQGERLIAHFKFIASMDIGEKRKPQNGSYFMEINGKSIGLRLSTLPSNFSESLVIRILPQDDFIPIEKLTLYPAESKKLLALLKFAHGLIIFTGPTGSGKTTTLYTLLKHTSSFFHRNVVTLEDPIEKRNEDILQVQVNEKAGINYSTGLKAILRHDPDIIMVGEIRDSETAKIAVRAALTGHLVLTTMHTKNSIGAIYRLLEFGVKWSDIQQTLIAVTAQRLVELSCSICLETCLDHCLFNKGGRAAVYELLTGKDLKNVLLHVKGENVPFTFTKTLKQAIRKGIALGFIREEEYYRWVMDDEDTLDN